MHVFHEIGPLRAHLDARRAAGHRVAFVPTMGALHPGHGACVAAARADAGALVVCSIFVNPTQFGAGEDLDAYPRTLAQDRALLEAWGCDVLFAPAAAVMYPETQTVWVDPGKLAAPMCGRFRPGHFRGVATVVAKLFHIVRPDVAVFGQKDAQQALVVRAMARQLCEGVEIRLARTMREPDGLAMSSRNAYLSDGERARAAAVPAALAAARDALQAGERSARAVEQAARGALTRAGIERVDYVEVRRADDLSPLERLEGRAILALAAWVGSTRLIDNMVFEVGPDRVVADAPLF